MFIAGHPKLNIAMHLHIFWDSGAPEGFQVPVTRTISSLLGIPATVTENHVRVTGFVNGRKQVDANSVLDSIHAYKFRHGITDPVLLVVNHDLFGNGHSFVFGLARPQVGAAVVSGARLTNEFYGRAHHDDDLIDRMTKEGAHEVGHLLGLPHCLIHECVMFKPDTLDELDRKKKTFCPECASRLKECLVLSGNENPR